MKILGIAPYDSLKNKLELIAENYDEFTFDCYIGDLDKGLEIAKEIEDQYDLIISRGGTAKLLQKHLTVPVIEIRVSPIDILSVIKLVSLYDSKYALVGFENITKPAKILSDILEIEMDIITLEGHDEISFKLKKLATNGYSLIIGDRISTNEAHKYGMNSILIESGSEAVTQAFNDCISTYEIIKRNNQFAFYTQKVLTNFGKNLFILDNNFNLIFYSEKNSSFSFQKIKELIKNTSELPFTHYFTKKNKTYQLQVIKDGHYIALTEELHLKDNYFIEPYTVIENSKIYSSNLNQDLIEKAKAFDEKNLSLFLYGEKGVGKSSLVNYLIQIKKYKNVWKIDFSVPYTDVQIENLFFKEDSIIFSEETIIIFSGLNKLESKYQNILLDYLDTISFMNTNWILIYEISNIKHEEQEYDEILKFINSNYVINLKLPSLSEVPERISSLISLYLYKYSYMYEKDIVGIDNAGLDELKLHTWNENIKELKSVIHNLVVGCKTRNISVEEVRKELKIHSRPEKYLAANNFSKWIDSKTLNQINVEIAKFLVEKNNGNKTKTADQLGISRTTLWKMLKN